MSGAGDHLRAAAKETHAASIRRNNEATDLQNQIYQQQKDMSNLKDHVNSLDRQITDTKRELDSLINQLSGAKQNLDNVTNALKDSEAALLTAKDEAQKLETQARDMESQAIAADQAYGG